MFNTFPTGPPTIGVAYRLPAGISPTVALKYPVGVASHNNGTVWIGDCPPSKSLSLSDPLVRFFPRGSVSAQTDEERVGFPLESKLNLVRSMNHVAA